MNEKGQVIPEWHGSRALYIVGFVLSLILTAVAYVAVDFHLLTQWPLLVLIACLALGQTYVQLICFLHLARERKPHWNRLFFFLMATMLAIIVLGSLWIMYHLNERTMPGM